MKNRTFWLFSLKFVESDINDQQPGVNDISEKLPKADILALFKLSIIIKNIINITKCIKFDPINTWKAKLLSVTFHRAMWENMTHSRLFVFRMYREIFDIEN